MRDRGEEKRKEKNNLGSRGEERTKWSTVWCAQRAFILGFTDGIPDEKLNIIIFKYSINDSVY